MEYLGRIYKVLERQEGVSARTGNRWQKLDFIFEYFETEEQRWSDKVVLSSFDANIINLIKEGMTVKIGFSHSVREYNGHFFNEMRIYKFHVINDEKRTDDQNNVIEPQNDTLTPNVSQQSIDGEGSKPAANSESDSDLPF